MTKPRELLSIDHFGPIARGRSGVDRIFVVTDAFSRYTKLYAVKSANTKSSIRALEKYIDQEGKPSTILSDNASCFTSREWVEHWRKKQVNLRHVSPHSPNANVVERRMSRIAELIWMHVPQDRQGKWVELPPDIERTINEVEVRTTGVAPVTIQHLVPVTEPLSNQLNIPRPDINAEQVYNQVNDQRQRNRDYRDRQMTEKGRRLIRGDHVYIIMYPISSKIKNVSAKLCPKARGPFRVIEEQTQNCYLVQNIATGEIESQNVRNLIYHPESKEIQSQVNELSSSSITCTNQ